MKQNQMDAKIRTAFERDYERTAPDVLDTILEKTERRVSAPVMTVPQTSRAASVVKRTMLMAAAILVVLGVAFVLTAMNSGRVYSTLSVDLDECLTLSLNREGKLVSASGSGASTRRIAKTLSRGAAATETIETVLEGMLASERLNPACNTVLFTAIGGDSETGDALSDAAFETARGFFDRSAFDGAVMACTGSDDPGVQRISHDYHISQGKAMMVNEIITCDRSQSIAALSKLSINDLNLIASMIPTMFNSIRLDGVPSALSLDGLRLAKQTVLQDLSLSELDIDGIDVGCGADDDGLLYIIRVHRGDITYTYKLSASTAEIIHIMKSDNSGMHLIYERPSQTTVEPTTDRSPETASPTLARGETYYAASATDADPTAATAAPETRAQAPSPAVPRATAAPEQPPSPVTPDPVPFDADSYHLIDAKGGDIPDSAAERSFSLTENSYDTFYSAETYPFGNRDGIYALVTTPAQFRELTGCDDERFSDDFFERRALIVIMDKETDLHYVRRIRGVYTDGDTLYIDEAPPVGLYSKDAFSPRVSTILYEIDRATMNGIEHAFRVTQ